MTLSDPFEMHSGLIAAYNKRMADIKRRNNLPKEFRAIASQHAHVDDDGLIQVTVPLWLVRKAAKSE